MLKRWSRNGRRWGLHPNMSELLGIDRYPFGTAGAAGNHYFRRCKGFLQAQPGPATSILFLMKDMDRAINRIEEAMARQEKVMVYGD